MARILLLDDNYRDFEFDRMLEEKDHKVTAFSFPTQALKAVKEQTFDLIITDLEMPQMNGIEFLKKVRELKTTTPAILITCSIYGYEKELLKGFEKILLKPIVGDELCEAVEELLKT